jgi:hypothetical protein
VRIKLKLRKTTCFVIGTAGAGLNLLAGGLMLAGVGPAQYAQTGVFVLFGGMLLLLGAAEKGPGNKLRRVRLLLLFFAWMLALPRLPLLDLIEMAVLPLVAITYKTGEVKDGLLVGFLILCEVAAAGARTLALVPAYVGGAPVLAVGAANLTVGFARGLAMLRLRAVAAAQTT